MNSLDCYKILGVARNSSQKEIKTAYRKLSLKYHPDRNRNEKDIEKFKKIIEAYQFLKQEEKMKHKKSDVDIASTYTEFWKHYEKSANEEFKFNKTKYEGSSTFGVDFTENYSHNQEKEASHKMTHVLLYGGLGVVALWIILSEIIK